MMTADEAIDFLIANNATPLDPSLRTITSARNRMQQLAPGSEQYQRAEEVLQAEIAQVEQAEKRQAYENVGVDPVFGMAICDCEPNEPCCMESGYVADGTDGSRKVVWPVASPPRRIERNLLVIAKELSGRDLASKVKTSWSGDTCCLGLANKPHISATTRNAGTEIITAQSHEVAVTIPTLPSFAVMLERYFPRPIVMSLATLDLLLAVANGADDDNKASFTPTQCFTDGPMGATLTVRPVPYLKLEGEAALSTMIRFSTAGVNGGVEASGSLTGQFGHHEITASAEAKAISGTGLRRGEATQAPGMIGMMANIIGTLNDFVKKGKQPGGVRDVTNYASSLTLSKSLAIKARGLELRAKGGSPDLELELASLLLELKAGITGRLDIIDALAMYFTGPGAEAIRRARAEMAAGKFVNGKLDAYLEVGAQGTLTHSIVSGVTIPIPANLPAPESTSIPEVFRGEIKIRGILRVGIEIEAEVWVFTGKAGASGTVNTAWIWSLRKQGAERQKKYEFEGLIIELQAHASARLRSGNDDSEGSAFGGGGDSTPEPPEIDASPEGVARHLDLSKADAERIARSGLARVSGGQTFTIFQPEDSGWEKY